MTAEWILKAEKVKFMQHAGDLFFDTTWKSNNEKIPLLLVHGKDENEK